MKELDLLSKFHRWRTSRRELIAQVDALRRENESLRERLTGAQKAKAAAESRVERLNHEKEALRTKVASMKKASESHQKITEQLGDRITELRNEIEKLRARKPR
jgi:chromosome segregation ATPase